MSNNKFKHIPTHSCAITIINEDLDIHRSLLRKVRKIKVKDRNKQELYFIESTVQIIKSLEKSLKCLEDDTSL